VCSHNYQNSSLINNKKKKIKKHNINNIHMKKTFRVVLRTFYTLASILCLSVAVTAQNNIQIKGIVTEAGGESVIGATVRVKNTQTGTITDVDGKFSLNVPDKNSVIVISSIGFKPQEIMVGSNVKFDIKLEQDALQLEEFVVTGYSKQSKRDITGAVSVIPAEIVSRTPATDMGTVLQGRVSGVSVDAQGGPGSISNVRIRGFGTNGNNEVLYVIDGVQMRGGSNLFNINDIETITVLKDPSITSLYGAQGGNGVIVITTKTGKSGAPKLEYNAYVGWESPIKYPSSLNPQQYANAYWGYLQNSGLPLSDLYYGSGSDPVLPDYIIERQTGSPLVVSEGDPAANPELYNLSTYRILQTNKSGTDWFRSVLGTAFTQSHQLNLSGATDKSNYALSLNYLNNTGVLVGTYFKRYSLRVNTEFKPKTWLKIGQNTQFSYSEGQNVSNGNHNPQGMLADLYNRSPLIPMYDIAGNYSGPKGIPDNLALHPGGNNPLFGQNMALANNHGFNSGVVGSAYIDIEPIKGLVVESKIGLQFYPYSYTYFTDTVPQNVYSSPYNSFSEGSGWSSDWRWLNKVSYDFNIKNIHKISVFAAYEAREYVMRWSGGTTPNLPYTTPSYLNLSNGAPNPDGGPYNTVNGGSDGATNTSVFGNLNYSLLDKYLLSFVIRRDGSSKFGPLSKYGIFPSYSIGWRISQEKFMKNITWIDDLKLRAAIGTNGNDAIPSGLYLNQYNTNPYMSSYDLGGLNNAAETGVGLYQIGNPYIHWETNKTTNIGFDAALFKNHMNISFSWFDRKTKDLLGVPPVTGLAGDALAPYENIMKFSNKGVELELGYKNVVNEFNYDLNFEISTYKNNVDYIDGDPDSHLDGDSYAPTHFALTRSVVGRPVSSFYGYVQEGIFQSADDFTSYGVAHPGLKASNAAGHFKFKDISGVDGVPDGKIDEYDRTFIGSPHPKFNYGFNVTLNYKGFDFGMSFQGEYGNQIFNYWRAYSVFPGAMGEGADDTWSITNTGAELPIWNNVATNDKVPSSFFIENGSYLRFKNLQLGYTIENSKYFNKLRMYVQANNLLTITKYTGIDPQISTGGATNAGVDFGGNYPIARNILIGISLGL
jgi:TonB-dependent starch-binding outer membrane protein SusC